MDRIEYIKMRLSDSKLRKDLSTVVEDVDTLIPQSEEEFGQLKKFGLYPAGQCQPFITKQGSPFYYLDNMSVIPIKEKERWMRYGNLRFRQLEVLYNMARMNSTEAHEWLKDHLFQERVDARKKQEYKAKFRGYHREDWKQIQTEWMKYCLCIKYRDCAEYRADLAKSGNLIPVEDATNTNYASNRFWGAELVELDGKKYYFGCNLLGKLHICIRECKGKLQYNLPDDFHLFGEPILPIWQ